MMATLRPCATSGCPELVDRGHCDSHRKQMRRDQGRERYRAGDPSMTAYTTATWHHARRRQLNEQPICERCGDDATVVDHDPPRNQLVDAGVDDPDASVWLHSLCKPCHDRKTSTTDGGFGRPSLGLDHR